MIDYHRLKEDDPGGPVEEALAHLNALTDSVVLESRFITVGDLSVRYSMMFAESVYQAMLAFSADAITDPVTPGGPSLHYYLPDWVIEAFGPFGTGFDIAAKTTQDELERANDHGLFDQKQYDALLAMAKSTAPRYVGLTPGDVEYARSL